MRFWVQILVTLMLTQPVTSSLVNGTLKWAGKQRHYMAHVPTGAKPTGLIVALTPVDTGGLPYFCGDMPYHFGNYSGWPAVGNVSRDTGAIVLCPSALLHNNTDHSSGTMQPCWKAFPQHGYCDGETPEDDEDVMFLEALIQQFNETYNIPEGRILMSGMSNGASMAYRFYCEKAELLGGLAIQSQAYFDPWVGFYDHKAHSVPLGTAQCKPKVIHSFYSDVGTVDSYYGLNVSTPGFVALEKWRHNFTTQVLGCSGEIVETEHGPHTFDGFGPAICYESAPGTCPNITGSGTNRFCSVPGMPHDTMGMAVLLPAAFREFFS